MLADPRPGVQQRIRAFLGTDILTDLEVTMAKILDALRAIGEQQQALSAAQLTAFTNLQNALNRLEQGVRDGDMSDEAQAALNDINEAFRVMQDAAGRADDGYEPQPETPAGDTPAEPGTDVPPTTDVPADENPTVPVEGEPTTGTDDSGTTATSRRR